MLMLKNSYSNSLQEFQTAPNYSFSCKPYGIKTFDEILSTNKSNKRCRQLLKTFYIKHPKLYALHHRYLHRKSFYHVEYENNSCIVYAKGKRTFSEILLKEGMAFVDKTLENKILKPKFLSLQNYAKDKKKGVFSDRDLMNCLYGN